jgi:hypothetical protein
VQPSELNANASLHQRNSSAEMSEELAELEADVTGAHDDQVFGEALQIE